MLFLVRIKFISGYVFKISILFDMSYEFLVLVKEGLYYFSNYLCLQVHDCFNLLSWSFPFSHIFANSFLLASTAQSKISERLSSNDGLSVLNSSTKTKACIINCAYIWYKKLKYTNKRNNYHRSPEVCDTAL